MFLTTTANLLCDALLTLAYPVPCALCTNSVESRIYGNVCRACWSTTQLFTGGEPVCWKCGGLARIALRPVDHEKIRCRSCDSKIFDAARACGIYEGALRESVLLLKKQPGVSEYLVMLLLAAGRRPPLDEATRIIPVPLHPMREKRRGFNQASVLARAIAPRLGLMLDEVSLIRVLGYDKYRAGLDAKGRQQTVEDAFVVRFPQVVEGETVLLVDDVFTTGATASSCAAALRLAGAKAVHVLTVARPR